jgi:hypothetical protein
MHIVLKMPLPSTYSSNSSPVEILGADTYLPPAMFIIWLDSSAPPVLPGTFRSTPSLTTQLNVTPPRPPANHTLLGASPKSFTALPTLPRFLALPQPLPSFPGS